MAITPDQRATLQLLLERGQSYGDLARLLAVDEAMVRARARTALTELGGADPDRRVGLTDYLLGQADPIGRADASRHLRTDPEDYALASTLAERLGELFPQADMPRLPGQPRQGRLALRRRATRDEAREPGGLAARAASLSASQTRLLVILGSAAVLLIVIVLAITGAFSGGGDQAATSTSAGSTTTAQNGDQPLQRVALTSPSGGDATADADFGLATGDQPFVDLSIQGLDPAPQGKTYAVWLMLTDTKGYPLSPITVNQQGSFQNRFSIPAAVLPVVARVRFVDISIAPIAAVRQVVSDAIKNQKVVLDKPGQTVLRGSIPSASQSSGQSGG